MALCLEWLDERCYAKMQHRLDLGDQGAIRFHALESEGSNQAAVSFTPAPPRVCPHSQTSV